MSRLLMQHAKFRAKYQVKQILSWITQVSIGSNKFNSIIQSSYRISQSHWFFHTVILSRLVSYKFGNIILKIPGRLTIPLFWNMTQRQYFIRILTIRHWRSITFH